MLDNKPNIAWDKRGTFLPPFSGINMTELPSESKASGDYVISPRSTRSPGYQKYSRKKKMLVGRGQPNDHKKKNTRESNLLITLLATSGFSLSLIGRAGGRSSRDYGVRLGRLHKYHTWWCLTLQEAGVGSPAGQECGWRTATSAGCIITKRRCLASLSGGQQVLIKPFLTQDARIQKENRCQEVVALHNIRKFWLLTICSHWDSENQV